MEATQHKLGKIGAGLVRSYLLDGYRLVYSARSGDVVCLRHVSNGNQLVIIKGNYSLEVYKNGALIGSENVR